MRHSKSTAGLFILAIAFQIVACNASSKGAAVKTVSKETASKGLTDEQINVTKHNGTERPFSNEYWNNHEEGLYVDIYTGDVLFSSKDKYDSGTGWPSFTKPLVSENIENKTDKEFGMTRTEVRSKVSDSHLGHVFDDGPAPTYQRYCMNSAALKFIPAKDLENPEYKGRYSMYVTQFKK